MPIPYGLYMPALERQSFEIVSGQRTEEFDAVVSHDFTDIKPDNQPVPLLMTNVHMVSGDVNPRLRKLDIPNPDIRTTMAQEIITAHNEQYLAEHTNVNIDAIREDCRFVTEACDAMEQTDSAPASPIFRTLSLFVIYAYEGKPLSVAFSSMSFAQTLALVRPKVEMDNLPEELLQQVHAQLAEADLDPLPFDKWKEQALSEIAKEEQELGGLEISQALGFMRYFMPPREATHPVINAELFDKT